MWFFILFLPSLPSLVLPIVIPYSTVIFLYKMPNFTLNSGFRDFKNISQGGKEGKGNQIHGDKRRIDFEW